MSSTSNEIIPGLFIGGEKASLAPNVFKFRSLINMTTEVPFSKLLPPDTKSRRYDIMDLGEDDEQLCMLSFFSDICKSIDAFMQDASPVLVYCSLAEQRSCTAVVAYLMYAQKISLSKAIEIVKARHPPAFGGGKYFHFDTALRSFEKNLCGANKI